MAFPIVRRVKYNGSTALQPSGGMQGDTHSSKAQRAHQRRSGEALATTKGVVTYAREGSSRKSRDASRQRLRPMMLRPMRLRKRHEAQHMMPARPESALVIGQKGHRLGPSKIRGPIPNTIYNTQLRVPSKNQASSRNLISSSRRREAAISSKQPQFRLP
jgi:hypothetical protein